MKGIYLISMLLVLLTYGCAKDDIPYTDDLTGTSWYEVEDVAYALYFSINHECTYVWDIPILNKKIERKGIYSYKDSKLKLKFNGTEYNGTIDFINKTIDIEILGKKQTFKQVR